MGDRKHQLSDQLYQIRAARRVYELAVAKAAWCVEHGPLAASDVWTTTPAACLEALVAGARLRDVVRGCEPLLVETALSEGAAGLAAALDVSAAALAEEVGAWVEVEVSAGRLTAEQGERLVALARGEVPS